MEFEQWAEQNKALTSDTLTERADGHVSAKRCLDQESQVEAAEDDGCESEDESPVASRSD